LFLRAAPKRYCLNQTKRDLTQSNYLIARLQPLKAANKQCTVSTVDMGACEAKPEDSPFEIEHALDADVS